jgi:hypothetical protein
LLGAALPSPAGRALVFGQVLVKRTDLKLMQNRIERAFIRMLKSFFEQANPGSVRFVVVADRGFAKTKLWEPLEDQVEFIVRTPAKLAFYPSFEARPRLLGTIASGLFPGQLWEARGFAHLTRKLPLRVVIKAGPEEPWILLTNIQDLPAEQIVQLYAQRMLIEQSFRDFQRGVLDFLRLLNRFEDLESAQHWVILGTLSHWVCLKLGEWLEKLDRLKELAPLSWRKIKARGYRRVLCLCRLGVLAVRLGLKLPERWAFEAVLPGFT